MQNLAILRREYQKLKTRGAGCRYPEDLKLKIVALIENGMRRKDVMKEIGINSGTLGKWMKTYSSFSKIEVLPATKSGLDLESKYTVESPNGFVIHGLTKSDLFDIFQGQAN